MKKTTPSINKQKRGKMYRFLEMLPGLTAWNIILFLFWGSLIIPKTTAYIVIGFLIYWFYQSSKSAILGIIGYLKIKSAEKINWYHLYLKEKRGNPKILDWNLINHVIIIPIANEPVEKIVSNLKRLSLQREINHHQLSVVLAFEERVKENKKKAKKLIKIFSGKFKNLVAIFHPPNLPGEIKGKASNEAWAAEKFAKKFIGKRKLNIKYLTVTSCDSDALFHKKYFSALTYHFAKDPERYLRFWQSPIFWHNNLNRVPGPIKIVGVISNIIHISHLQEPDKLSFNYSCYSLSYKLLKEVGYWDKDIIPEDWHIFLQTFFAKKGKVTVHPIFLPTSIDAPEGENYFHALKNRYLQCQRHAWGATDIPYAIDQARKHKEIPLILKLLRIYKLLETHLIWSTNWFILTLGATLPPLLNPKFFQTSLGYNLPKFSQIILTACLFFLLITIILDWKLRPKSQKLSFFQSIIYLSQWILMPIATLFMSALPGLDAQTKLMTGKRLEYKVTKKYHLKHVS